MRKYVIPHHTDRPDLDLHILRQQGEDYTKKGMEHYEYGRYGNRRPRSTSSGWPT
jgi:hypothetical protein